MSDVREHPDEPEPASLKGELGALEEDIASARSDFREISQPHPNTVPPELFGPIQPRPPAPSLRGERVALAGRREIVIRAVEPGDSPNLETQLERLSALSGYRSLLRPIRRQDPRELAWITQVDHRHDEALVALDPRSDEIVAVARYVCDPDEQTCANVTCIVADGWRRRGVGTALIERLAVRASDAGVERLRARMLADEPAARRLLARVSDGLDESRNGDVAEITARLRGPASG